MSNTQFAFLRKERVPGKEAWQKAIDEFQFDIRLGIDPELEPFEDEGFSPCKWGIQRMTWGLKYIMKMRKMFMKAIKSSSLSLVKETITVLV